MRQTITIDYLPNEVTAYLNKELTCPLVENNISKNVYSNLKNIAINRLSTESPNSTLCVTSLVHEAVIRNAELKNITWKNRKHFYGAMAEGMRRIIIDRARYHNRNKREGEKFTIPLEEELVIGNVSPDLLVKLDDAINDLELNSQELALLIKLKFYGGLSSSEIAELQKDSIRTIDRKLMTARAWLLSQLEYS